MFSPTAQRLYFVCGLLNIGLLATAIGAGMALANVYVLPDLADALIRLLLFPEVVGTAVLLVAMSYFWLGFDSSRCGKRTMWFLLVYFFHVLALPFYYFIVYRSMVSHEASNA
jgi:hypothetical protein